MTLGYEEFVTTVKEGAHISDQEAERVSCATLKTLADRLSSGETEDLAERLPEQLRSCLVPDVDTDRRFHVDEFLHRVAARTGIDDAGAERDARAVFAALRQAVGPEEFADMRSELPKDFDPLLDDAVRAAAIRPDGLRPPLVTIDAFLDRLAQQTGLDRDRALRAAEAVLEVLAIRISAGQIEDIEPLLPPELRPALERGRSVSGERAVPLSVDAFLQEVAQREDADRGLAAEHARAVLAVLREVLPEQEFLDMKQQLPGEYSVLLKRG
jgi:uncharacterized protein (DUF2267 family)